MMHETEGIIARSCCAGIREILTQCLPLTVVLPGLMTLCGASVSVRASGALCPVAPRSEQSSGHCFLIQTPACRVLGAWSQILWTLRAGLRSAGEFPRECSRGSGSVLWGQSEAESRIGGTPGDSCKGGLVGSQCGCRSGAGDACTPERRNRPLLLSAG